MSEFKISLDDLLNSLSEDSNDVKKRDFDSILNLNSDLNREIYLGDIDPDLDIGTEVEARIRFWNEYDKNHNIPEEERKPIKIYINSCGGSFIDGLIIVDAIKLSKTPVWTICTGSAYSAAFDIFIVGHKRFAYPNSSFLLHEGSIQNAGTMSQTRNYSAFCDKLLLKSKDYLLKRTSFTEEEYEKIRYEDFWMNAEEAFDHGCIDVITKEFV